MNPGMFAGYWELYQGWSRTLTSMACGPWRLLASQCEAGVGVLDSMLAVLGAGKPVAGAPAGAAGLGQGALGGVRQGLAPPRGGYARPHPAPVDLADL